MRGHYRCYRCYTTFTGGKCISDTVYLFPSNFTMPYLSSQDKATDAIPDLITIIRNTGPTTPFLEYPPRLQLMLNNWLKILEPKQHQNNRTHTLKHNRALILLAQRQLKIPAHLHPLSMYLRGCQSNHINHQGAPPKKIRGL